MVKDAGVAGAQNARKLLTVNQFCEKHPAFSHGSIRYMIFHADQNGMDSALIRIGRRVLIDEEKFFHWLDSIQEHGGKR